VRRAGYSFLELQVSLVVFGVALAGLGPLVIMHLKQVRKVEERCSDQVTYYLVPSTDEWARKLGASASIATVDPGDPPAPPVTLIDNGDAGYYESGPDAWHDHSETAINGDLRCHPTGVGSNTANWEFTNLPPGWYEVLVTWHEQSNRADNAPFAIYDGVDVEGIFPVNQQVAPSGAVYQGRPWASLGVFAIHDTSLRVELSDLANDSRVVADAVRIVPWRNALQVLSIEKTQTSEDMTVHVSITTGTP
jgi:hypothetical protein